MKTTERDAVRRKVRERYAGIAQSGSEGCACASSCCATGDRVSEELSEKLGYSSEEIHSVPEGSNMGLGCGNPHSIAELRIGETVLDLGSGGGFDCFLAARQVGETGQVIGVDMTPDMVSKARENAQKGGYTNVSFRLGEIEYLPVADQSVDVILSNCVINLSPDKLQVFKEAYRILRPEGRLAISDIVATAEVPDALQKDFALYAGCIAGASKVEDVRAMLAEAGFVDIEIDLREESRAFIRDWFPGSRAEQFVVSATIQARKRK
ncbi:MAG: arsenite methyltransferase [Candidatus Latescibacterota bacterium]